MELGISSFAEANRHPVTGETPTHGDRLRDVVAEIELAERVGLDVYGLGEHHRIDMAASSIAVTLAAAAARTSTIRLSSAVVVLSSADPVRTYQDFATLDLISSGRAELLVGRGSFTESFPLFGYSLSDYNELFAEKLELLLAIRDNERVTWEGKFRSPLVDQGVYPRAMQDPFPISIGVGGTPASMVRAAQLGLPVTLAIIGGEPAPFRPLVDLYQRTLHTAGHDPEAFPLAVHGLGYVADNKEEAIETIYPGFKDTMTRIGRERGWPPLTREQFDWMAGPDGSLVVGNPQAVADKILQWREILGIERFMLHSGTGNLPQEQILRSVELLGTDVSQIVRGR
ncbi:MAG: LLM class flavin-dependent oxidoreductase [bacterium]|nr:LLM class flavin-dependent oxidoreductase [bacterium]